ncbi:MAG: beta-N-acetylhexosaminidase [Candidatus Baltobacteraceae bacterium]
MSELEQLAAGVVCVGFSGTRPEALDTRLLRTPFAGFILFARNVETPEQMRVLCDVLQQSNENGSPRLIAIDQEGGRVARMRAGVEQIPSMMAVSAAYDVELATKAGQQMGFDLRRAGVNLDFAPVLDLALFEKNTVIGARAFSDDPQRVTYFAGAFAAGLESAGVFATYKHFPGHGSTDVDSHLDLPVIEVDEATLRLRDLVPFAQLLPQAHAVMTAHIVAYAFDKERAATLSRRILTQLLREELMFKGVCFTDCMQMDAIAKRIGSAQGGVEALRAGADCVLISHSIDLALETIASICNAVENGTLPIERLEEARARVGALRAAVAPPLALDASPPHAGIGREIGRRAVTLIRGYAHAEPKASFALSFEGTTTEGVQGTHSAHAPLQGVQTIRLALEPSAAALERALAEMHALAKRPIVLMRRAHLYETQRTAIERVVQAFPNALLVSTREPYDAFLFPGAMHMLCTYGDDEPSMQGLADVLFAGHAAQGRFPLDIR